MVLKMYFIQPSDGPFSPTQLSQEQPVSFPFHKLAQLVQPEAKPGNPTRQVLTTQWRPRSKMVLLKVTRVHFAVSFAPSLLRALPSLALLALPAVSPAIGSSAAGSPRRSPSEHCHVISGSALGPSSAPLTRGCSESHPSPLLVITC